MRASESSEAGGWRHGGTAGTAWTGVDGGDRGNGGDRDRDAADRSGGPNRSGVGIGAPTAPDGRAPVPGGGRAPSRGGSTCSPDRQPEPSCTSTARQEVRGPGTSTSVGSSGRSLRSCRGGPGGSTCSSAAPMTPCGTGGTARGRGPAGSRWVAACRPRPRRRRGPRAVGRLRAWRRQRPLAEVFRFGSGLVGVAAAGRWPHVVSGRRRLGHGPARRVRPR